MEVIITCVVCREKWREEDTVDCGEDGHATCIHDLREYILKTQEGTCHLANTIAAVGVS